MLMEGDSGDFWKRAHLNEDLTALIKHGLLNKDLWLGMLILFQVSGETSRHIYLWQSGYHGNKGGTPWVSKAASDKEEGLGGGRGNLVKMLDDLGQHLTPEIMDWSAAST